MAVIPDSGLQYVRADEIAECWNGVVVNGDYSLYEKLWSSLEGLPKLSEVIDIENSGPGDALGVNCVADSWDYFTEEEQKRLNALASLNKWGCE